jgi:multidrug efflux system membrane fusion protein
LFGKDIPALLEWWQRVELGTLVDGMVTKVNVVVGQQVNRGTMLVELDQREIQARLAWAESQVAATKLQQDEARRELDRSLELFDRTLLSNHERIVAEINAAKADALFLRAEAELTDIRMQREYSRIKAPFDGIVAHIKVYPGQVLVNRLQVVPLVTLIDASQMRVIAQVDAETATALQAGTLAKVGLRGEWLPGEIISVGLEPTVTGDNESMTYPLEIAIKPPEQMQLRAGEKALVRIDE